MRAGEELLWSYNLAPVLQSSLEASSVQVLTMSTSGDLRDIYVWALANK